MEVLQTVPILRIFDVAKAREFYLDYLGFRGDASPGATVFLRVTGLEDFHRELGRKDYRYQRPGVEVAPWNAKLMTLTGPFGNRLRFNEDLK
jgi:hypothetical protein